MIVNLSISDWEVTTERFVAFIDIMGFKDLVSRSTHKEIYDMMCKIDGFINDKLILNLFDIKNESCSNNIYSTKYSDSIILYSKDNTFLSLDTLICTLSNLMTDLFNEGIPFKGAISYGVMTLDINKSIFFGQPLIDAYLLQEEVLFYGIVLHSTAHEKVDYYKDDNRLIFLKDYFCPLKNGIAKHVTLFPMYLDSNIAQKQKYTEDVAKLFRSIKLMRYKTSGYLRRYIDNTETYFNAIKNNK